MDTAKDTQVRGKLAPLPLGIPAGGWPKSARNKLWPIGPAHWMVLRSDRHERVGDWLCRSKKKPISSLILSYLRNPTGGLGFC